EGVVEGGRVGKAGEGADAVGLVAAQPEPVVRRAGEQQTEVARGQQRGAGDAEQPQGALTGAAAVCDKPEEEPSCHDDDGDGDERAGRLGQPAGLGERQHVHRGEGEGRDERRYDQGGEQLGAAAGEQAEGAHAACLPRGRAPEAATARPATCTTTPRPGPASRAIAARTSTSPGMLTRIAAAATTATHQPTL